MEDILFKDDDLDIKNGDFNVGNSDQQGIELILRARPGHFYQFPTLGIGIDTLKMGSINSQAIRNRIKENLLADGYRINKLLVGNTADKLDISIDATKTK